MRERDTMRALTHAQPVPQRVHLVGIGGAGMSAIARILAQRGHVVSGSDLYDGRAVAALRALGVSVSIGHEPHHVADAEVVVPSSAVAANNPELVAARERGIPVRPRARLLGDLLATDRSVLVAGTHGKTTTTSMIVVALHAAGVDPTFAIGGELNESGTNAHAGTDAIGIAEADESDRSFLAYEPDIAVVTNVELDHPEVYEGLEDVLEAFTAFLARRRPGGYAVMCIDDPGVRALRERVNGPVLTYGVSPDADVRLVRREGVAHIVIDGTSTPLDLAVPGEHNQLNAAAALATVHLLGASIESALVGLGRFRGAARRFQRIGTARGIEVVDDYAHHPTELRATLAAARTTGAERIVCVVQPHRYSRTAVLGEELGRAAAGADAVIVTEVYGAGEPAVPGVNGLLVARAAEAAGARVRFEPNLAVVADLLVEEARAGDLVLITGAGDVSQVGPMVLSRLEGP